MLKNSSFQLIAFSLILALTLFLSFIFFLSNFSTYRLEGTSKLIADVMIFYLYFVMGRTGILIIFSFGDFYFRKNLKGIDNFPLVSVIIPCYNEEKVILNVLNSLKSLDYPNFEIIVVDDGSTDSTFTLAKEFKSDLPVRVIFQENAGKSHALNFGISQAMGDYVLCMDADSRLESDVLKLGIAYFEKNPALAAVAGSVRIGNAANLLTLFQRLEYIIGLNFHKTAQSFLRMVTIIPGPIGLFKKSVLLSVDGYMHDSFAEDCDLTIRLLVEGYEVMYCPTMIARTEAPEDFNSLISQRYRWSRGIVQAIKKHSKWLVLPHKNLRNFSIVFYMITESIFIPVINFIFAAVTIIHAVNYGAEFIMGPFFASLTLLDLALSVYGVATERSQVILILLAAINRITYGLALELIRFFAIFDEIFKLPMNWGKLIRKGF